MKKWGRDSMRLPICLFRKTPCSIEMYNIVGDKLGQLER
jgi:hypothetical protein